MKKQYALPVEKKEQKIPHPSLRGRKGTLSCELLEASSFSDRLLTLQEL